MIYIVAFCILISFICQFFIIRKSSKDKRKFVFFIQGLTMKFIDFWLKPTAFKLFSAYLRNMTGIYLALNFGIPLIRSGINYYEKGNFWNFFIEFQFGDTCLWLGALFAVLITISFIVFIWTHKEDPKMIDLGNRIMSNLKSIRKSLRIILKQLLMIRKDTDDIKATNKLYNILPIVSFENFSSTYNKHGVVEYVNTPELNECAEKLLDVLNHHVRLLGLSGMGKTFLVQQVFSKYHDINNVFYYPGGSDTSDLHKSLQYLSIRHKGAIVILDNCRDNLFREIISNYGTSLHFLSIFYDPNDYSSSHYNLIRMSDSNSDVIIQSIVDQNQERIFKTEEIATIKKYSGNIPFMALLLVQALNKTESYTIGNESMIFDHLLEIDGIETGNQRIAMETLALCQPLEYNNGKSLIYKYIIQSDNFTPLTTNINRPLLFKKVIQNLMSRNLMEEDSVYINMRPQPLAIWLVGEWIRHQGINLKDSIIELSSQEAYIKNSILEAWAKRLEYMQGNSEAEKLYSELVNVPDGPFANEDVIGTEFGSRLILGMCTVAPQSVSECLFSILYPASIETLKIKIKGEARRNIVYALEKLCFAKVSFKKSAMLLARLSLAENENWENNSTGLFTHLFQLMLAGTEASLEERFDVIKSLDNDSKEYRTLLIKAMKGAFAIRNLYRMGGAEKFGFIELHDYVPSSEQVHIYWENIYSLLDAWMDDDSSLIKTIADIVCSNTRNLINSGNINFLVRWINDIAARLNFDWKEMHKALIEAKNYDRLSISDRQIISTILQKLTPKSTIDKMNNAVHDLYTNTRLSSEIIKNEEIIVLPYVHEFIEKKEYLTDEFLKLIDNDKYQSWAFIKNFSDLLPEEDIEKFLSNVRSFILLKDKSYKSSILIRICENLSKHYNLESFIKDLFDKEFYELSISLYAVTDDKALKNLIFLMDKVKDKKISIQDIRIYINSIRLNEVGSIYNMAITLKENGADYSLLFDFISTYWYLKECYADEKLMLLYKKVILNYPLAESKYYNYEYTRIVKEVLQNIDDSSFAQSLNQKLIDYLSKKLSLLHVDEIYEILLTSKYHDVVWKDFSQALVDVDKYPAFFFNVKNTLGGGVNLDKKNLLEGFEDRLKLLCKEHKNGAVVCAAITPVFNSDNEDVGASEEFHPFAIWLIENYGSNKRVLDEFSANFGTYFWVGSTIPLLQRIQKCLVNLKKHPGLHKQVYVWIDYSIKILLEDIKRQERSDAYLRLAYGNK